MVKIHFGGSRSLSQNHFSFVSQVVQASLSAGASVHVGCAVGADQAVVHSALSVPSSLFVFAQFSQSGQGSFSGSAVQSVLSAQSAGASVSFLAGGPLSIPLRARLLRRSVAALRGCSFAVFFLAHPARSGSLNVAAQAVSAHIPVFVFPLSFSGQPAPLRAQAGVWLSSSFSGFPCLQWSSGPRLF